MVTPSAIQKLSPGETLWDDKVKGLHVRVSPTGRRSYYLFYRTKNGTQRRPKIGEYPTHSLQDMRSVAREMLLKVARGEDPSQEWKEARAELTVRELYQKCWDEYWNTPRFQASGWASNVTHYYSKNLSQTFGSLKLSEVTPATVRKWLSKYRDQNTYAGNRSFEVLKRMFHFAEEMEIRPAGSNPCTGITPHTEKVRTRAANAVETAKIIEILNRERFKNPRAVVFLLTMIFSGPRPRSLERATWDMLSRVVYQGEVYGVLTFDGKSTADTGEKEVVVLPPHIFAQIQTLPKLDNRIFGIKTPRRLWDRVRKEAGCPDLWVRDWRRTFASVGLTSGVESGVLGELLNHHSAQTTKIYTKLLGTKRLQAASHISAQILDFPTKEETPSSDQHRQSELI